MCAPGIKKGKGLEEETVKKVEDFFRNDEISRTLPGNNIIILFENYTVKRAVV